MENYDFQYQEGSDESESEDDEDEDLSQNHNNAYKTKSKFAYKRENKFQKAYYTTNRWKSRADGSKLLPRNAFFVRKGFCLVSRHVPASEDLNKINVYLRKAATKGLMYAPFEVYLARLLFEVPRPLRQYPTTMHLYLPSTK